jgi:hypothetical protein
MPLVVTIAERVVPWASTRLTCGSEQNASITPVDSAAATSTSMSPTVVAHAPQRPGVGDPLDAGHLGEPSDQVLGETQGHGQRDAPACLLRPADGGGKVRLAALAPPLQIAQVLVVQGGQQLRHRRDPQLDIHLVCPLGSQPRHTQQRRSPAGTWARNSSSRAIRRFSRSSRRLSAMCAPTAGIAIRPLRSRPSRSRGYPAIDRAAFSYDRTRYGSPPEMARRSASSCTASAATSFERKVDTFRPSPHPARVQRP